MKNVEELLGGKPLDGVLVMPKGAGAARVAGAAAGGVAGSAAQVAAEMGGERAADGAAPLSSLSWGLGYIALTDDELILLEGKRAMIGTKATGVLTRVPRSEVAAAQVGSGKLTAPLTIEFRDGSSWEVSVGRADVKNAQRVAGLLGG